MVLLYNWHLHDDMLWGISLGHKRLPDGLFIHTSCIVEVKLLDGILNVYTHSGTHYYCKLEDINLSEVEETKDELRKLDMDISFLDNVEAFVKAANEKYELELTEELEDNDFFMELIGYTTRKAYFKKDGKLIYLPVLYHCGMSQDSYLFREFDVVDVRYWDYVNAIRFYHVSDGVERICIKCHTTKTFSVSGVGKKVIIEPGDIKMKFIKAENCYEGLISPDCVNGKSALH